MSSQATSGHTPKTVEVNDHRDLLTILESGHLRGYPTPDTMCLPVIGPTNYAVKAHVVVSLLASSLSGGTEVSICHFSEFCSPSEEKTNGEIGCVRNHLVINLGPECVFSNYVKVDFLVPSTVHLLEDLRHPTEDPHLYCLYGETAVKPTHSEL